MRKYIAVPLVGIMAALSIGFAASLAVSDSPPMQVGTTNTANITCADSVRVLAWGFNHNTYPGTVEYATIEVENGADCAGGRMYVQAYGPGGGFLGDPNGGFALLNATDTVYRVDLPPHTTNGPVNAQQLQGVRIAIDQGHNNWGGPTP